MTKHPPTPTPAQVIPSLEREFGLVGVNIEPIPGYDQTNFLVQTKQDRFFLRRYPYDQIETAKYHTALYKHYESHGIPVASVIPKISGECVMEISGYPHLVHKYLDYPLLAQGHFSSTKLNEVGRWLARIHDVPPFQLACPYTASLWNMERFDELLALYQANRQIFPEAAQTAMESFALRWNATRPRFEHLPRTVIHNDYHQNNLMFDKDRCVGIIDFTEAMPGARIVDVAASLQYLAFGSVAPKEVISSFLDGYAAVTNLRAMENLPILIQARAAISLVLNLVYHNRLKTEALKILANPSIEELF